MRNLNDEPSILQTRTTGEHQGLLEGSITPFSFISLMALSASSSSRDRGRQCGCCLIGAAFPVSIQCLTAFVELKSSRPLENKSYSDSTSCLTTLLCSSLRSNSLSGRSPTGLFWLTDSSELVCAYGSQTAILVIFHNIFPPPETLAT